MLVMKNCELACQFQKSSEDLGARSTGTSNYMVRYCGIKLFVPALNICFWHTRHQTYRIPKRTNQLTQWGHGTNTNIGSDNGLSPGRRQAIIWTNAGILLIGPLATNFSEILIEILAFSFTKMRLKVLSAKWRPFCLGLNVLNISRTWDILILPHPTIEISRCMQQRTSLKWKMASYTSLQLINHWHIKAGWK